MRSLRAWIVLAVILLIELIAGIALVIAIIPTFPQAGPEREQLVPLWVSLVISLVLSCVWVLATLIGAIKRKGSWVRGSAVTMHILMFAAAMGIFQGIMGTPLIGAVVLAFSLVGFFAAVVAGMPEKGQKTPLAEQSAQQTSGGSPHEQGAHDKLGPNGE